MALMLSAIESAVFNCKVGRAETDVLNTPVLEQALIEQSIDFCRLKVNSAHISNYKALANLNMPFQFCGSILKYSMDFFNLPKPTYKNKGLVFEVYNPATQQAILTHLIKDTFKADPIGYHKNHLLSTIFTKQQEVECMSKWYVSHCDEHQNKMVLMKIGEQYIGYISIFQLIENTVDTPIAGVLPQYQGQKMFDDLRTYRHLYCLEKGIQYGTAGARIENNYSQQTFINDGMQQVSNEAIYIITPFLNRESTLTTIQVNEVLSDQNLFKYIQERCEIPYFLANDKQTYQKRSLCVKPATVVKCTISAPIWSANKKLAVIKYFDQNDALCLINWLEN